MKTIKCPNCQYEGVSKSERSLMIHFMFLVGGLIFFPIWIIWIFYFFTSSNCVCKQCGYKNVIKKNQIIEWMEKFNEKYGNKK